MATVFWAEEMAYKGVPKKEHRGHRESQRGWSMTSKSSKEVVRRVCRGQGPHSLVRKGKEFGCCSTCCKKPLDDFKWRKDG